MTTFILQRDKTVACRSGHVIVFKKGVETFVPPAAHSECMAVGAVPTSDLPQEPETTLPVSPQDPAERQKLIIGAIEQLRARGERNDFDASGRPHPKAIGAVLGFSIDARERNRAWDVYTNDDEA